ncbi:MAG TPA: hypothetical protein VMA76_03370, partial [Solirubrobacteraceae bacterium]|nr:hypothetical protein [Solirubrobacteraceae bacterium]
MTSWPTSVDELIDAQRALAATVAACGGAGATDTRPTRAPHSQPAAPRPQPAAPHPQPAAPRPQPAAPHPQPAIGACVVVFPRGLTGAGVRGDPAWAAAAVLRRG